MEGKEVRFGAPATAAWVAMTTGASNGSVNGMHSSLMPLGGGIAMFLMHLGEILPGGIGSGIAIMVVMAVLSVFVAGLMVGRTPNISARRSRPASPALDPGRRGHPGVDPGLLGHRRVLPEALKG
jgi:K+-transporting ATPase ATPase A chain